MRMNLSKDEVDLLASQYPNREQVKDNDLLKIMRGALVQGHLTPTQLMAIAVWKDHRFLPRLVERNTEEQIAALTKESFSSDNERVRASALMELHGVGWPMASCILHWVFEDQYPVLDWRAMAAVGASEDYNFYLWIKYKDLCLSKATELDVSMRTLDKALWVKGGQIDR